MASHEARKFRDVCSIEVAYRDGAVRLTLRRDMANAPGWAERERCLTHTWSDVTIAATPMEVLQYQVSTLFLTLCDFDTRHTPTPTGEPK